MNDHQILDLDAVDFFIDTTTRNEPIVGVRFNGILGDTVTVPMNADTADQVGDLLKAHARLFRDGGYRPAVSPSKARLMRYPAGAK